MVDLFLKCGRVIGVTARYKSDKLKALNDKVSKLWYSVPNLIDRDAEVESTRELCVFRGEFGGIFESVFHTVSTATVVQLRGLE